MPKILFVSFFTLFFGFAATTIHANTVERIFPQAELVAQTAEKGTHYLLPLGRVKEDRSAGRIQPSHFQRLQGDLTSITWKLENELSLQDAVQQIDTFLSQDSIERLFTCQGRDCGESFSWANAIFKQPMLFGSDRSQYLWVIKDKAQSRYHVFYLIERPNRRIYFQEDSLLVPDDMAQADRVQQTLARNGRVLVADVPFANGTADFSAVVSRIKGWQPEVNVPLVLVLHRHGAASDTQGLQQRLASALQQANLDARVEDVANLAPDPNATGPVWVEWINPVWEPGKL